MQKKYILLYFLVMVQFFSLSCNKDFLEAPTDRSLIVPTTLSDFSSLLDNTLLMNFASPSAQEIASDDIFLDDARLGSLHEAEKQAYVWGDRVNDYFENNDWSKPYVTVFYSNVVLDGLQKIERNSGNGAEFDRLRGSALFFRAWSFYNLAQVFSPAYVKSTSASEQGIVLRLSSDPNDPSERASLEQTYTQIISDLGEAVFLLPFSVNFKTRPTRIAAIALLAKVHLTMGAFAKAEAYADSTLNLYADLLDYNSLNAALPNPFSLYNKEVIFHSQTRGTSVLVSGAHMVDTVLMQQYDSNDLRKILFFEPRGRYFSFYGRYGISELLFNGLATDEVYLIKAECAVRKGEINIGLSYLNNLLKNRYKKGRFIPLNATSKDEALMLVLRERRKELVFRGSRWSDIKRLNKEGIMNISITRKVNGSVIVLPPNDLRYQFLIPETVIRQTGIKQNPR